MESACEDLRRIIPMLPDIGLEVNPSKSEVSNVSCDNFQTVMLAIESAPPGVTVIEREDICILKAQIDINGCRAGVHKAVERLSVMSSQLESIDANPAFFSHLELLFDSASAFQALMLTVLPATLRTDKVQHDIAASGIHGLQRQVRRYRVATVNTSRRTR